jgi:hypothetical protein
MNYVLDSFFPRRAQMLRAVVEEAAALVSVALVIGTIVVWVQIIGAF